MMKVTVLNSVGEVIGFNGSSELINGLVRIQLFNSQEVEATMSPKAWVCSLVFDGILDVFFERI